MMVFLLSVLGGVRSGFTALFGWLSRRSMSEIGCIVLGIVALIAVLNARAEKRHSAKLQAQIVKLTDQINKITSAKSEQRTVTKTRIIEATRIVHDADKRAKVIESAPLPGNCKTPPQILGADL